MNRAFDLSLIIVLAAAIAHSPTVLADQTATQKMAKIVADLNHEPDDKDKAALRSISDSGSDAEKVIANALLHMKHRVSQDDKDRLDQLIKDNQTPKNTRELAEILKYINHYASAKDREKLQDIAMPE